MSKYPLATYTSEDAVLIHRTQDAISVHVAIVAIRRNRQLKTETQRLVETLCLRAYDFSSIEIRV